MALCLSGGEGGDEMSIGLGTPVKATEMRVDSGRIPELAAALNSSNQFSFLFFFLYYVFLHIYDIRVCLRSRRMRATRCDKALEMISYARFI